MLDRVRTDMITRLRHDDLTTVHAKVGGAALFPCDRATRSLRRDGTEVERKDGASIARGRHGEEDIGVVVQDR